MPKKKKKSKIKVKQIESKIREIKKEKISVPQIVFVDEDQNFNPEDLDFQSSDSLTSLIKSDTRQSLEEVAQSADSVPAPSNNESEDREEVSYVTNNTSNNNKERVTYDAPDKSSDKYDAASQNYDAGGSEKYDTGMRGEENKERDDSRPDIEDNRSTYEARVKEESLADRDKKKRGNVF